MGDNVTNASAHPWVGVVVVPEDASSRIGHCAASLDKNFFSQHFVSWVGTNALGEHLVYLYVTARPSLGKTVYELVTALAGSALPDFRLVPVDDVLALETSGKIRRWDFPEEQAS